MVSEVTNDAVLLSEIDFAQLCSNFGTCSDDEYLSVVGTGLHEGRIPKRPRTIRWRISRIEALLCRS